MFSVALSVGLLLPAVSRRAALRSPDFPPAKASDHPIPFRNYYVMKSSKSQVYTYCKSPETHNTFLWKKLERRKEDCFQL